MLVLPERDSEAKRDAKNMAAGRADVCNGDDFDEDNSVSATLSSWRRSSSDRKNYVGRQHKGIEEKVYQKTERKEERGRKREKEREKDFRLR